MRKAGEAHENDTLFVGIVGNPFDFVEFIIEAVL